MISNKTFKFSILTFALFLVTACGLPKDNFSINEVFSDPQVAELTRAIEDNDLKKIDLLLQKGVDVNARGKDGITPFYWFYVEAPGGPKKELTFKYLLNNGAESLTAPISVDNTVLHLAATDSDSFYLEAILKNNPNINIDVSMKSDYAWPTPLYRALKAKRTDNLKILIKAGADIEYINDRGDKPIDLANLEETLILLKAGADYRGGEVDLIFGKKDLLPRLIWSLEKRRFSSEQMNKSESSRSQIIEFLRNEGVEVYPWYPKDDPRYNPRPPLNPASIFSAPFTYQRYKTALEAKQYPFDYSQNYETALNLLKSIRNKDLTKEGYENFISNNEISIPNDLISSIHEEGLYIYDANTKEEKLISTEALTKSLSQKEGLFYDFISNFAYHYSNPFPQYQNTQYITTPTDQFMFIRNGSSYGLLFTNEEKPKLLRIESYNIADM